MTVQHDSSLEDKLSSLEADVPELDDIETEVPDTYASISGYLLDYVGTVVKPLFKEAAGIDAKFKRALSFPTHVTTAVFTAAILYIYDRISTNQPVNTHDVKLLCTATSLHDINKFWNETTGSTYSGNYQQLISDYFYKLHDPFALGVYFEEWENELDEIAFLVQHAQEHDVAQEETRLSRPKYGKLLPYVKLGDKTASLGKLDNPLPEIRKRLRSQGFDVQLVWIPEMQQQLLSQNVYYSIKQFIVEKGGVPLLISPQGILYLAKDPAQLTVSGLKPIIGNELINHANLNPVISDRKLDLSPLISLPLDQETQFEKYLQTIKTGTEKGLLSELGETIYPEDPILQESLSALTYFIYSPKGLKELEKRIQDDTVKSSLLTVNKLKEQFAEEQGGQKCKPFTVHELVSNCTKYEEELRALHDSVMEAIYSKFVGSDVLDELIQSIIEYNDMSPETFMSAPSPRGNYETCFMCGRVATKEYKPGRHFIQKNGFTKRLTLNHEYKRQCDRCAIEQQLLNYLIQSSGFDLRDNLLFFCFYFDSIFFNVDPFLKQMSNVEITASSTEGDKLAVSMSLANFKTPFHIVPMVIRSTEPSLSSISTRRARAVHTAIRACLEFGCKCTLITPCTVVHTHNEVFYNEQPSTLEMNFGLARIRLYRDARLLNERLTLINKLHPSKGLYNVQRFERMTVIPYIKACTENFDSWVTKKGEYVETLFGDTYMSMKTVAEKGISLFGTHRYSGSHTKTKIFRTAFERILISRAKGFSDETMMEFAASGVAQDVYNEKYAPKKGKDIENDSLAFVQLIVDYLKENDLWNINDMAKFQNSLVNQYEFAYILAVAQKTKENEEDSSKAGEMNVVE